MSDITPSLASKSDQINAIDIFCEPVTVKILSEKYDQTLEQPLILGVNGGLQPFKPGLTCRRIIAACLGKETSKYVGHSLTLYCDPSVHFGKEMTGGIRISHSTGIDDLVEVKIRLTRTKYITHVVTPLHLALSDYPAQGIIDNSEEWAKSFANEKTTPDRLIATMRKRYILTDEQCQVIRMLAGQKKTPQD